MSSQRLATVLASAALASVTIVPAATAYADQPPVADPATITTTVGTDATWTNTTAAPTVVECNGSWAPAPVGSSYIWSDSYYGGTGDATCSGNTYGFPGTPTDATVTFSKTFTLSGIPEASALTLRVDDSASVTVNGTSVTLSDGATSSLTATYGASWSADITGLLRTGSNTVAITAQNNSYTGVGNPGGLAASLSATSSLTDKNWCKNGGWQQWTTPVFANQGDCVSYVVSHSPHSN